VSFFAELKRRNVIRVGVAYLVASWLLIEASSVILDIYAAPDWVSKVIVALLAIGLPVALFFAWAFELTPEGVKREHEVDRTKSVTHETAKRLDVITIVLVVIAAGLLVFDRFFLESRPEFAVTEASSEREAEVTPVKAMLALGVAVLPFSNLSADEENAFFASGVHEDVLTYLSRVANLRVISRTSVNNYANSELSLPAIGRELGVSHVVEGSVRRAGDRVRVTVQLIDATSDKHVWAENYDRTLDDIFAIQTEIAQTIVARVEAELSPAEAASLSAVPTTSTEAYDAYIVGRELFFEAMANYNVPGFAASADEMRKAVELDPNFLLAWKQLVEDCTAAVWFGLESGHRCHGDIDTALARMKALAPNAPDTRTAQGIHLYRIARDLPGAIRVLEGVLKERPNDIVALNYMALSARRLARWDIAEQAIRRTVLMDPVNPRQLRLLIEILSDRADYAAGIVEASRATQRLPDSYAFWLLLADLRRRHLGEIEPYAQALADTPAEMRFSFGDILVDGAFESVDSAIQWYEASTFGQYSGDRELAEFLIGRLLSISGDDAGAATRMQAFLDGFDDIAETWGRTPDIEAFHAQVLASAGRMNQAREHIQLAEEGLLAFDDVLRSANARATIGRTLALMGEPDAGWQMIEPLIRQPGGPTDWELYQDLEIRKVFAEVPAYQALVARLDAELESRQESN
jgi:TolB-like protein